jgi:Na+/H+ antiporter NhaD/arsenite permease-like protein
MLLMLPFAVLLIAIALAPIIVKHHWERHYHRVCFALAAIVCGYYVFVLNAGPRVLHAAFEYFSFIAVVGSFFVVSGGIHLRPKSRARPSINALFLFLGALLANVIGTIGASMLLIRPWIHMNKTRFSGFHLAFFIFVVSNVGGALFPVGPPLVLGYLKGVPFAWPLLRCWPHWLVTLGLLLPIFYLGDLINFRAARSPNAEDPDDSQGWHCRGQRNFFFMSILLLALIGLPPIWREAVMIVVAIISFRTTPVRIHQANAFSFAPLKEVGWLFLGIFGTMIPVLDYAELHAADLGLHSDLQFFWATGILSALLDNAPTYLTFFAAALGLHGLDMNNAAQISEFIARHDHYLVAISLGATFFGALTYIGNGPNLLVKAIAENMKVPAPGFFGYMFKYAIPVLLPIFALVSFLFFR